MPHTALEVLPPTTSGDELLLREAEKRHTRAARAKVYRPDPRDDDDPLAPPRYLRAAAYEKVGETADTRRACLAAIRAKAHAHVGAGNKLAFPRINDDKFLLAFARCKKMDSDRAFEEYLNYARFDAEETWLRNVDDALLRRLFTSGALTILSSKDLEERSILSVSVTPLAQISDEFSSNMSEVVKAIFFIIRMHTFNDVHAQVHGAVIIGDMKGYRMRLVSYLSFHQYKQALHLCQWCLPLRANAFYVQNEPRYVRAVVNALRTFMKPKVRKSFLCCGSELSLLHSVIARESLPVAFGGTLTEKPETQRLWLNAIDGFAAESDVPPVEL